ncbi:MAG TPA: TolC family protein [Xanthomonadales bacterium]|nr:TolC family protein [Xanthomonadales bacterium]
MNASVGGPRVCAAVVDLFRTLALVLGLTGAPAALAQASPPGADLESVHIWLREHNPELQARSFEADAASERIQPAGALPDPMAEIELMDIDFDNPRVLPGQTGSSVYRVRQSFPLWGKRQLARDIAGFEADASGQMRDATLLELIKKADAAYVRYWHAAVSVQALDRVTALMGEMRQLTQARYAAGLAPQQDAIKAQLEVTRMGVDRLERLALGREASAALNVLLGRMPGDALAQPQSEPTLTVDGSLDDLLGRLAGAHPMVLAQSSMASAAESMSEMARRERYPDLNVGVALVQVGSRAEAWELMFSVDIPLQQTARRHRERAAELAHEAAQSRQQMAVNELRGMVGEAWVRWQSAQARRQLIEDTLLPQAQASFQSALSSYQVGSVDFESLLDALRESRNAELTLVDARRDELIAASEIRAIQGELQ